MSGLLVPVLLNAHGFPLQECTWSIRLKTLRSIIRSSLRKHMWSQWDLVSSFWLKTEGDTLCPIGVSDQSNGQNGGDILRGNGRNAAALVKETIFKCACAANESAVNEKQPHVHFGCNGIVCSVDTGSSWTSLGDTTPLKERLSQGGRKGHTLWERSAEGER